MLGSVLGLYKRLVRASRKLRGVGEDEIAYNELVTGKSWDRFCDTLKSAGASVMGMDSPKDPLSQAEGYRYLSRLVRAGLEAFIEYSDPRLPVFRRMVHETVKMGADNPDNHYLNCTISGEYEYLISGYRNSVHFLGFSTQKGNYGDKEGLQGTGFLDSTQLETREDGYFTLVVSAAPREGNWLPMERESNLLIARQTFLDKDIEVPAEITIKRIDSEEVPEPLSPARVSEGLDTASKLVAGASLMFARWAKGFQKHINTLPLMDPDFSTAAGGDPKIAYYHSYWKLAEEEALVIEVTPPKCEFWNFQVNNHWMESLDYRYHRIHINGHTARYNPDGSVRIVVAGKDPGCDNWLTTAGHDCGTMLLRWVKAETRPQPQTGVVSLQSLREEAAREA